MADARRDAIVIFVPVLSRLQWNDLYSLASNAGFDPNEFERNLERATFTHSPTGNTLAFTYVEASFDGCFPAGFTLASFPPLDFGFRLGGIDIGKPWEGCSKDVQRWLADVRANHEAPDLWAEARKARTLADAAGNVSGDNSPFTPVELSELQPRLNEIEAYIESQQPQDSARQETLRSRFKYLYEPLNAEWAASIG